MNTLEILLSRRWILKSRDRELYYQVKDDLGRVKKFLTEKLGYQVIVNPYLIKVEKLPAKPENWMGIKDFTEKIEYVFFCLILMFLEDKEAQEQFVLSSLTEYVQSQYKEEQIDWTIYHYRRHLIKVIKYCVNCGILEVDDGSEESFARDYEGEVLYENTGISRYFVRNFTQDIMGYSSPSDFEREEWIDVNEDRGIVRRQRVYRQLLMTMGMYRGKDTEEDFGYVRNFRNMIQGELEELFDCELQVHRTAAFLILGEDCRLGRWFPEENTVSDIVLLFNGMIQEMVKDEELSIPSDERISLSKERFSGLLERLKEKYGAGFPKKYREMTSREFVRETGEYMEEMEWIEERNGDILLSPITGKIIGKYPEDFHGELIEEKNVPKKERKGKKGSRNHA